MLFPKTARVRGACGVWLVPTLQQLLPTGEKKLFAKIKQKRVFLLFNLTTHTHLTGFFTRIPIRSAIDTKLVVNVDIYG